MTMSEASITESRPFLSDETEVKRPYAGPKRVRRKQSCPAVMIRTLTKPFVPQGYSLRLLSAILFSLLTFAFLTLFSQSRKAAQCEIKTKEPLAASHFSGAFSRFPARSSLSAQQRRITLITQWTHDDITDYLPAFMHSVQHNADVADLLFVNRIVEPGRKCVNFTEAGIDITWGGNIKQVCLSLDDWKDRMVGFLCNEQYGWACSSLQREEVRAEMDRRRDVRGWEWKPFRGELYRDLLPDPHSAFWAWVDVDTIMGDLRHFPFALLANSSFISFDAESANQARLTGQFAAFNYRDERLKGIWKMFPTLQSPEHLTKALAGEHQQSDEEQEWSYRYLNVEEGFPGRHLDFAQLADAQGDDFFDPTLDLGTEGAMNDKFQYIISGRDVILSNSFVSRSEAERLIDVERNARVDDHGWSGWSLGEDGSDTMVQDERLTMEQALYALENDRKSDHFRGKLRTIQWSKGDAGCGSAWWIPAEWRLCHPKESRTPALRTSFVHFAQQKAGYLFERQEVDQRPRPYSRYLLKHTLRSKNYDWLQMPHFNISDAHVMTLQHNRLQVWMRGSEREHTIFNRQSDGLSRIG